MYQLFDILFQLFVMYILIDLFALTVFFNFKSRFFLNQHETNVSNLDDQTMANLLKLDL